jgi:hypothetical protein
MAKAHPSETEKKLVRAEEGAGQFGPSRCFTGGFGCLKKGERVLTLSGGDGAVQDTQPEPCEARYVILLDGKQRLREIPPALANEIGIQ